MTVTVTIIGQNTRWVERGQPTDSGSVSVIEQGSLKTDTGNVHQDGIALQPVASFTASGLRDYLTQWLDEHPYIRSSTVQILDRGQITEWVWDSHRFDGQRLSVQLISPVSRALDEDIPVSSEEGSGRDAWTAQTTMPDVPTFSATASAFWGSGIDDQPPVNPALYISGDEVVRIGRVPNVGANDRGLFGTRRQAHDAGSVYRRVYDSGELTASGMILYLLGLGRVPSARIDSDQISSVSSRFLTGLRFRLILTEQDTLGSYLAELMQLVGGILYYSARDGIIRLALRTTISPVTALTDQVILDRPLPTRQETTEQITRCYLYCRFSDVTEQDESSATVFSARVDADAEGSDQYGQIYDETIVSRMLQTTQASTARSGAIRATRQRVARYRDPVREYMLRVIDPPEIGAIVSINHPAICSTGTVQGEVVRVRSTGRQPGYEITVRANLTAIIDSSETITTPQSISVPAGLYQRETLTSLLAQSTSAVNLPSPNIRPTTIVIGPGVTILGGPNYEPALSISSAELWTGRSLRIVVVGGRVVGTRGGLDPDHFDGGDAIINSGQGDLNVIVNAGDVSGGGGAGGQVLDTSGRGARPLPHKLGAGAQDGQIRSREPPDGNVPGGGQLGQAGNPATVLVFGPPGQAGVAIGGRATWTASGQGIVRGRT